MNLADFGDFAGKSRWKNKIYAFDAQLI